MIVSHSNKFIYIKGVKVASTSTEIFFEQFCNEKDIIGYRGKHPIPDGCEWYNHMNPQQIKEKLNNDHVWKEYFKFGCIRNPWDRVVSEYFWLKEKLKYDPYWYKRTDKWKLEVEMLVKLPFEDYCTQRTIRQSFFCLSLYKFYRLDKYHIDFFIRFEHLYDDIQIACDKLSLNCDISTLLHQQKSNHKHYTEYYTDETRNQIAKTYKDDIDFFNYKFGDYTYD